MKLGPLKVKNSVIKGKSHPHHVGVNMKKSRKRVVKGGLKQFRS